MTEGLEKFGKLPEHLENHSNNIDGFKNEIRQLAERTNDPHLRKERLNLDLLNRDDFLIYEEYKAGTLNEEKFKLWKSKTVLPAADGEMGEKEYLNKKRKTKEYFSGYLVNKIYYWKLYADRVKSNKDFFKEFTNYVLAGGKIIDFYKGFIKPKKWIRITRINEKGESVDILPPNADPNNIINRQPTLRELRYKKENLGSNKGVKEISENPTKETKEDF